MEKIMKFSYYFAKLAERIPIAAIKDFEIYKKAHVCSGSDILGCKLGRYSYMGKNSAAAHCEIGMGSVAIKDIEPYEVWSGNPARLIKKRFIDPIIEGLLKSEWWIFFDEKIQELAPYLDQPELFLEKVK